MKPTETRERQRLLSVIFYYGPLLAWIVCCLLLATSFGSYNESVSVIYAVFTFVTPETTPPTINSMYGLTYIVRRGAYTLEYGIFALLLVRALQHGQWHLRKRSLLAAIGMSLLFAVADNSVRLLTPGRHGGWDDILLSLTNVALFTGLIYLFFVVKSWERHHLLAPTDDTIQ